MSQNISNDPRNKMSAFMDMKEVADFLGFKSKSSGGKRAGDLRRAHALRYCKKLSVRCGKDILIPFTSEGRKRVGKWMVARETLLELVEKPDILSSYEKIEDLTKRLMEAEYRLQYLEEKLYLISKQNEMVPPETDLSFYS